MKIFKIGKNGVRYRCVTLGGSTVVIIHEFGVLTDHFDRIMTKYMQ